MEAMASGLPLVVPVQVLEEFFQCSICLNLMKNTVTTHCGHRYCNKCITEWVDRNHNCPCCNAHLINMQLIKDVQFDSLIEVVNQEKDKSEASYFEHLVNEASVESTVTAGNKRYSPVEEVLKKHLKQSLASHENYFQGLNRDFRRRQHVLERQLRHSLDTLRLDGISLSEIPERAAGLQQTYKERTETMKQELKKCTHLVADAYDRYLVNHIPTLEILPVSISVLIVEKNIRIPGVILQPVDCVSAIQSPVENALRERGDSVLKWDHSGKVILVGPLTRCTQFDLAHILANPIDNDMYPDVHQLTWQTKPILQYRMKPGSEIALIRSVKCESDMPKVCFVEKYRTQGTHPVDYFSCKECAINWICRSCVQVCHQGHDTKPYVMNHQPTWACCYCPKKKKCLLINARQGDSPASTSPASTSHAS